MTGNTAIGISCHILLCQEEITMEIGAFIFGIIAGLAVIATVESLSQGGASC